MIIGITGFMNSGKDTAADYLVQRFGFTRDSFAAPLKDVLAVIFGWDRNMLEGATKESREERDQIDHWWAKRLNLPKLTPRLMLQQWGTEVCRRSFHNEIWIASLENRLRSNQNTNIVISDCRFPNELSMIRDLGGKIIRIQRGPDPSWMPTALAVNRGELNHCAMDGFGTHPSEWSWLGSEVDVILPNNDTIADLHAAVLHWLTSIRPVIADSRIENPD